MKPNQHALELARRNSRTACNLMFRGGPCDICGGGCLSQGSDQQLAERVAQGLKPVGTFAFTTRRKAKEEAEDLKQNFGLTTKVAKNRWGMWVVVATRSPDEYPEAFTDSFLNETDDILTRGRLYGYPRHLSEALAEQVS